MAEVNELYEPDSGNDDLGYVPGAGAATDADVELSRLNIPQDC